MQMDRYMYRQLYIQGVSQALAYSWHFSYSNIELMESITCLRLTTHSSLYMCQWHIFIILIVSCIITLVAPSNLIIIASLGMEVYKSPLKFQADCIYTSQDMVFLKSWFSHTFCIVMGNPCPPQYKCMGKP